MHVDEHVVVGEHTKYPLPGLLTIPMNGSHRFPAVVLVHGSGPNNMDEQIGNTAMFRDLSSFLSERGIAVLRYDKRTLKYKRKLARDKSLTLTVHEETVEDAILAGELLKQDERIDPERIFLIGHSLGGMLAPRIDAEGGDFAGLIIMGGSPRRLENIMEDQNEAILTSVNVILKWIIQRQLNKLNEKLSGIYELTDEEAKERFVIGKQLTAYYFKDLGVYPTEKVLQQLTKPVLILHGEKDFHVSTDKDFNGYKGILAGKNNVEFKSYRDLNHLFMPSVYGDILKAKKEYKVEQQLDRQVADDIADFILANVSL